MIFLRFVSFNLNFIVVCLNIMNFFISQGLLCIVKTYEMHALWIWILHQEFQV